MTDSIKARMEADLKVAMKAGDVTARETLRFTLAALKNAEIDKRSALTPTEEMDVLKTQSKRRVDSIEQYRAAGRVDLVDRETAQLEVLKRYMPTEMSDDELTALVRDAVARVGASSPKEMGKVMPVALKAAGDRASGKRVSDAVRQALAGGA
ncbi:MAG TPA: GatB/YqeY domain-containing protein [Thermomicrobiales bacterium]|nr:GatB/YqeY domain-containing protein [Thermomicrobiales bacterium]